VEWLKVQALSSSPSIVKKKGRDESKNTADYVTGQRMNYSE
jgi:hypothetical protein